MQSVESDPLQFGAESSLVDGSQAAHSPAPSAPPAPDVWEHYPAPTAAAEPEAAAGPLATHGHYPTLSHIDTSTSIPLTSPSHSQGAPSPHSSTYSYGGQYPPLQQPGTPASVAGGGAGTFHGPQSSELHIAVRHPQQHAGVSSVPGIPGSSYLTYEVVATTTLPHFSSSSLSVRRRFKDFVSLSRLLPQHLHGSFLPARPHRNALGSARNSAEFVAERRAALERYMNRLAAHHDVARSEVLRVFLEADGNLRSHPSWLALKPKVLTPAQATQRLLVGLVSGGAGATPAPSEVVQPAAVRHDLYRLLKEGTAALRRGGSGNLGPISQEEAQLREAEALLEDLGSAQGFARSLAARWVAALRGVAAAGADLGVALAALAEYEGSCRRVDAAGLQVAAQGCTRASSTLAAAATATSAALQPLTDYADMQVNIMGALAGRRAALGTLQTLSADLEGVRGRLASASLLPATQARKVEALRNQVSALEAAVAAAQGEYSRQVGRNAAELTAYREQRGRELAGVMVAVAAEQASHWRDSASNWEAVAARLTAIQPPAARSPYRHAAAAAAAGDGGGGTSSARG